tara:strand:+ start:279 stop:539 length:261 start_codon:yes stop_codon:yes gene_type:complete
MTHPLAAEVRAHATKNSEKNPLWAEVAKWTDAQLTARLGKTTKLGTALTSAKWYCANPTVDPLAPKAKPEPKADAKPEQKKAAAKG